MNKKISVIWKHPPKDLEARIDRCLGAGLAGTDPGRVKVFFRADDIFAPEEDIELLLRIFAQHDAPLALAVVPAMTNEEHWQGLYKLAGKKEHLWCWHQHGWQHKNHQTEGKCWEFGDQRTAGQIEADLSSGYRHLESLMGENFFPAFTPPWNRCNRLTLDLLKKLGYYAVSRYQGSCPSSNDLPDLQVNVDLHTRKDVEAEKGWIKLFRDIETTLATGMCGFMIHHNRMNQTAFEFIDLLLSALKQSKASLVGFQDLLKTSVKPAAGMISGTKGE